MAFKDFREHGQVVRLLQRSLEHGRLAHAYLFSGERLDELEALAGTLAKSLNCLQPLRGAAGVPIDCCDRCANCVKISHGNHADVHWVRPESKSRSVTIDQMRALMQEIYLRPAEAEHKVAVIVAADRMNVQSANAFLKTLEEPPAKSVLLLLTTEPQQLLETILSRCLRLNFGTARRAPAPGELEWLAKFSEAAAAGEKSLLSRYRLLDVLLQRLSELKAATEDALAARSPLRSYPDADKETRERWEQELAAAIEAEYRRQRSELLRLLLGWLRDVWWQVLLRERRAGDAPPPGGNRDELLYLPRLAASGRVAARLTGKAALENLLVLDQTQRLLRTNVQEALALEVGLLKLHL
jgi:DNA polymerase-3 subunit delta'